MLPDYLSAELDWITQILGQAPNRWDGFAPDLDHDHEGLRAQILFTGWAAAALAAHASASPEQRDQALASLAAASERLIQRRVWATWATLTEQAGITPDPIHYGGAAFSGALTTLLGLSERLGVPRYHTDPLTLRWTAEYRFSYTHPQLNATLTAQMRTDPSGAIPYAPDKTSASAMALILWGLQLANVASPDLQERWLQTVRNRMILRGPRLPNRGAFAASYNPRTRRASFTSQPLEDALALALMAPLAPDLVKERASRHWPVAEQSNAGASLLAISALLAGGIAEPERAERLLSTSAAHPDGNAALSRALRILVHCGGLTIAKATMAPSEVAAHPPEPIQPEFDQKNVHPGSQNHAPATPVNSDSADAPDREMD